MLLRMSRYAGSRSRSAASPAPTVEDGLVTLTGTADWQGWWNALTANSGFTCGSWVTTLSA
jgi:hypothetical protein